MGVYGSRHHNKWLGFTSLIRRVGVLLTVRRYDRIVIEKELIPYFPAIFERLITWCGVRYAVDFDDAIFHNYDVSSNKLIRFFFGRKIDKVMQMASLVIAGNNYIADRARKAGATKIALIPTVIDISKYHVKQYGGGEKFVIGWIGSPITQKYLAALKDVFVRLSKEFDIELKLVGVDKGIGLPGLERLVKWTEQSEVLDIQTFNVGIMPLEDNIWERGKCGYKLIQYMGCGVPVVGTPIGVNEEIIREGINGYKANSPEDWFLALRRIILGGTQEEERLGLNGRALAEEMYSLSVFKDKYYDSVSQQAT